MIHSAFRSNSRYLQCGQCLFKFVSQILPNYLPGTDLLNHLIYIIKSNHLNKLISLL